MLRWFGIEEDSNFGLGLVFLIFLVIIVVVVLVVLYIFSNPEIKDTRVNNTVVFLSNTSFFLSVNQNLSRDDVLSYEVFDSNDTFLFGGSLIAPLEVVNLSVHVDVVKLRFWGDSFYFNESECFLNLSNDCKVSVFKKGFNYDLAILNDSVWFNVSNGYVQKPLFCFAYHTGVSDVLMPDLKWEAKPQELITKVDVCYRSDEAFTGEKAFKFVIRQNPSMLGVVGNITVFVSDSEVSPYVGVGLRNVSFTG